MKPWVVTTTEAAELLARPEIARLLKPFMKGQTTVSSVAQAQGISVEKLHYRVQQFYRAGLLQVVGEVPRQGRSLKLYEAVSTDFVFPVALLRAETLRKLLVTEYWLSEFMEGLEHATAAAQPQTVQVTLTEAGTLMWGTADWQPEEPAHPAVYFTQTAALYLMPGDAEELARELAALNRKYQGRQGPKRYAMILGVTPLPRPVD